MFVIKQALNEFAEAFRLKTNAAKYGALASKSVLQTKKDLLESIFGIPFSSLGYYLGFNLIQGRVKREHFTTLLDRVKSKLSAWRSKLLNKAGRVILAKTVVTSIHSFVVQTWWLSQSVCDELDRRVCHFIWSRKYGKRGLNLVNYYYFFFGLLLTHPRGGGEGFYCL